MGSPDSFVLLIATTHYLYAAVISEGASVNSYRNCVYLEVKLICTPRVHAGYILASYLVFKMSLDVCLLSMPTGYYHSCLFNFALAVISLIVLLATRFSKAMMLCSCDYCEFQTKIQTNIISNVMIVCYKVRY